ncbi:MAG: hypothetical protein K2H15_08360, partial [Muribaculaceae bacterium]|nr:hypothetical protein [Muribaculaceae bacterium]
YKDNGSTLNEKINVSPNPYDTEEWNRYRTQLYSYWEKYQNSGGGMSGDEKRSYLDSALFTIDSYENRFGQNELSVMDRLGVLTTLKRYDMAADYIRSISQPLFDRFPGQYKEILFLRIRGMQSFEKGDTIREIESYKKILKLVEKEFSLIENQINPYFESYGKEKSRDDTVWMVLCQLIAYTNMTYGHKVAEKRLDQLYKDYPCARHMDEILRELAKTGFERLQFNGY